MCIQQEVPKFLEPGYFHGDLVDTMLTCLLNVLQTPIIVLSSIAYHPFFASSQVPKQYLHLSWWHLINGVHVTMMW